MPHWLSSNLRHLRLKNTLHVAPVVIFAIAETPTLSAWRCLLCAGILHLLVFPASVGFNAFYDRDTAPTGGLISPPPVHRSLLVIVGILEGSAVLLSFLLNTTFAAFVVLTIMASRLYSHERTRVKGRPILGYLWVVFFQGAYSFVMVMVGIAPDPAVFASAAGLAALALPAAFCSLLVAGSYPLTQVYQFEEDAARGDTTIAMLLGKRHTFHLSMLALVASFGVVAAYFITTDRYVQLVVLASLLAWPFAYLSRWYFAVRSDTQQANHQNAQRMSWVSAVSGTACFLAIAVLNHIR